MILFIGPMENPDFRTDEERRVDRIEDIMVLAIIFIIVAVLSVILYFWLM